GVAAEGAADYLLNCSTCHGNQAEGVDGPPLRNSQYVQTAGDQALFQLIVNGVPGAGMPAWLQANGGPLTGAQINNVVAYLHTLQNVKAVPPVSPPPPEPTPTPLPPGAPTPEPARPSEPGGPGPAANMEGSVSQGQPMFGLYCALCHGAEGVLGVANLDSDDMTVPALNPIDPTIANPNPQVFATNVDLFMEHGSIPEGEGPLLVMPPFGDAQMLTPQQIADLIAYVMSLNGVTFSGTPAPSATPAATGTPTPAATAQATAGASQQVTAGQQAFSQQCAMCHGANLQGVSAPSLTASTVSRFGDAGTLLDFVSRRMPPGSGGSLSQKEYEDITAYILEHDGLLPGGTILDTQNASRITLSP
ncbi:MAG: c-type cytochrome, partial [Anaerolineae bacterium]